MNIGKFCGRHQRRHEYLPRAVRVRWPPALECATEPSLRAERVSTTLRQPHLRLLATGANCLQLDRQSAEHRDLHSRAPEKRHSQTAPPSSPAQGTDFRDPDEAT